ncbi:uncharacterized protein LOC115209614 [Octopus sinensis]|uniref:Uncharacterized protein LOC115209614 n=2 Tax=Octopus TaxID=6643 RepID=A0A6P7S6U7_9MOLL|nr:uncharacterized protein LOC115209614 [Octopus sinensis]
MRIFQYNFLHLFLGICQLGSVFATKDVSVGIGGTTVESQTDKLVAPGQDNLERKESTAEKYNCPGASLVQVDLLRLSYDYSIVDIDIIQHVKTKLIIKEKQSYSREIVFDLATSSDQPRSRVPHLEHRLIKKNDSLLLQVTVGSAASSQPYKISNVVLAITITAGILLCFLIMVLPYLRRIYIEDHALTQDDRSAVYVINKGKQGKLSKLPSEHKERRKIRDHVVSHLIISTD